MWDQRQKNKKKINEYIIYWQVKARKAVPQQTYGGAPCTMGTGGPFPGDKAWPGRDADHLPPSSAEVENE
jgi:hypothetical protein